MSVIKYRVVPLTLNKCPLQVEPRELMEILKAWRKKYQHSKTCSVCDKKIEFGSRNFGLCCGQFYFKPQQRSSPSYHVRSIAVPTPGFSFLLPQHKRMLKNARVECDQEFLVLPDPMYWQLRTTLVYDRVMKFVLRLPMTSRSKTIHPPSRAPVFFKQLQEAPLNYGSLDSRSCGKATFIRQVAYGKRCSYSMRGMIVPDPTLRANEIRLPDSIVEKFGLKGKWVILNRMPSLQPENFVALRVPTDGVSWPHDCFGIPLEILPSINGDFDGDEVNIYLFFSALSQAECATLMNPEWEMGSSVMGMKLSPSQDMLSAYYMFYDEIDFLPFKTGDLTETLRVIYEVYGSKRAFRAIDDMRLFYLEKFRNDAIFALSLKEMNWLADTYRKYGDEARPHVERGRGCLVTQISAKAKGNFELLEQIFGRVGMQGDLDVKNSFWSGLSPCEAVAHAKNSHLALWQTSKIWQPGYGHNKIVFNLQGLSVDYLGRVMDGKERVVENDVLDIMHYTDVLSVESFKFIFRQVIELKNFELAKLD